MKLDYLPLHFNLKGKTVLVVGGGEVAFRKVELLVAAQANIRLVALEVRSQLRELIGQQGIITIGPYDSRFIEGVVLVISATSNKSVNQRVHKDATTAGIPVNVVDTPELCSVIFPGIVDRSPVIISVSTGGATPVLARYIKSLIDSIVPQRVASLATYLKDKRQVLRQRFPDFNVRRKLMEAFLESPGKEMAENNQSIEADRYLFQENTKITQGEVYLVGAGPGDPDLLTLRALQLLQTADVILYDNLVSDLVLERARRVLQGICREAQGYKSTAQEDINSMLRIGDGQRVVRLGESIHFRSRW